MADFTWLGAIQSLSSAALTVRAQTISPNDNGRLLWDIFFPRQDVPSVDLSEMTSLDHRPAADRREWDARGRLIHILTPAQRDLSMVPIEAYFKVDEYEMQKLNERVLGNQELFKQVVSADVPRRTDIIVESLYRRLELDAFSAWANGSITQRNPQTGQTYTASFGFAGARYQTAGTAWNNGAVNAYDQLIAFLEAAIDNIGSIGGVMLRLATYKEIQADAPRPFSGVQLTRNELTDRIQQEFGTSFRFFINETSLDVYTGGGTAVTRTKVWTAQRVAAVPAGIAVGLTGFAPVLRAMELVSVASEDAGIDIRGATVYRDSAGAGRDLTVEAQINAMPIPNEQNVWVINAGV